MAASIDNALKLIQCRTDNAAINAYLDTGDSELEELDQRIKQREFPSGTCRG
jgi:hypothetical protein